MEDTNRDIILFVFGAVILATLWVKFWVEPRDEFFAQVMDCMGERADELAYNECATNVSTQK